MSRSLKRDLFDEKLLRRIEAITAQGDSGNQDLVRASNDLPRWLGTPSPATMGAHVPSTSLRHGGASPGRIFADAYFRGHSYKERTTRRAGSAPRRGEGFVKAVASTYMSPKVRCRRSVAQRAVRALVMLPLPKAQPSGEKPSVRSSECGGRPNGLLLTSVCGRLRSERSDPQRGRPAAWA